MSIDTTTRVAKYVADNKEIVLEKKHVPQEQLQREYDYFLSQQILESMLKNGLINEDEFNKITILNRKSFSPAFAQIMPRNR